MTTEQRTGAAFVLAIGTDVATKLTAVRFLDQEAAHLGVIELRVIRNSGVAFGLGTDVAPWVLLTLTSSVALALLWAVVRGAIPGGIPVGLILGGAVANIGDRMLGGNVIDMFDLGWWPAFNVAVICIVLGVGSLLFQGGRPTPSVSEGVA